MEKRLYGLDSERRKRVGDGTTDYEIADGDKRLNLKSNE